MPDRTAAISGVLLVGSLSGRAFCQLFDHGAAGTVTRVAPKISSMAGSGT